MPETAKIGIQKIPYCESKFEQIRLLLLQFGPAGLPCWTRYLDTHPAASQHFAYQIFKIVLRVAAVQRHYYQQSTSSASSASYLRQVEAVIGCCEFVSRLCRRSWFTGSFWFPRVALMAWIHLLRVILVLSLDSCEARSASKDQRQNTGRQHKES